MKRVLFALFPLVLAAPAVGKVVTRTVPYTHGPAELEGVLAYDDERPGPRPGVLVVHEWWGLNDFARQQAEALAQLGYVALAVDMYGKGRVTTDPAEAGRLAGQFREDPRLLVDRVRAGLAVLASDERVRPGQIGAIGFCFGGSTVLALAFSGADVAGVVSFHGSLTPPSAEQLRQTRAKLLILHGAADTLVPAEQVGRFQAALAGSDVDWQMVIYGGAKHSFTNPAADKLNMPGVGYQKSAAERSWRAMAAFFAELFR